MRSFDRFRRQAGWYASYGAMVIGTLFVGPSAAHAQCPFDCNAGCYFEVCGYAYSVNYAIPANCNGFPFCEVGDCATLSPGLFGACNIACEYGMWARCALMEA